MSKLDTITGDLTKTISEFEQLIKMSETKTTELTETIEYDSK